MTLWYSSPPSLRGSYPGSGRTVVYRGSGACAPEYGREHQWPCQVVEYFPVGRGDWGGYLPGLVVEAVFRGELLVLVGV